MNLEEVIAQIQPIDQAWVKKARQYSAQLAIPPRALGRLHDMAERLCGIFGTLEPRVSPKTFLVMAGDHGVVADGVSAFPQEVTGEMVKNFLRGGAAINALARSVGSEVLVVDMGIIPDVEISCHETNHQFRSCKVDRGTANITQGPAMSRQQAEQAILHGFQLASEMFAAGTRLLGTGDMGIGNTTPSAAIGVALTGMSADQMVGRGTGIGDEALARKREIVQQALEVNQPDPGDGLGVLAKVGGFEIGGIAGCILAGAGGPGLMSHGGGFPVRRPLLGRGRPPQDAGTLGAGTHHRSSFASRRGNRSSPGHGNYRGGGKSFPGSSHF
jgi:nicotinate-nucleotide--dimethylbenzimidazole phosphoribosyltransferase